jgi:hypothetical protein
MIVEHVEVLLEEPSMEEFMRALLPKLIGQIPYELHPFQGKHNLLSKLPHRLKGYASWLPSTHRILVLVDADTDDCRVLKGRLEQLAIDAGLVTRSSFVDGKYSVVNRIVIEELEAWYFGDWDAVRRAFPLVSTNAPRRAALRRPDEIKGGTWEALERELRRAGYFANGLEKVAAARSIAPHMNPAINRSPSFCALRDALQEFRSRCSS